MKADPVRVGILISGRGSNMASLVKASEAPDSPYRVVRVLSNVEDAGGLAIAAAAGIPTWAKSHKGMPRAEFDALLDAELRAADVELIALAGYMRLLSPEFIAGWQGRILNIHPSLLPLYKGLDTHARAIAAGDAEAGCSVHVVTPELDDGPVVAQARVPVLPGDTPDTLAERVLGQEHALYARALADYARSLR
ncbi:phosphoribosylglycinamide formyltransferase [Edaphosphingomonas haloaromaticamans]|nr:MULTISPECIES: phosphoribosylglycinamide formyltransferase [Sphingomonas]MDX3883968.1 phosphoribosylglycinamide formyltransferase [Sphingomonas sp.]